MNWPLTQSRPVAPRLRFALAAFFIFAGIMHFVVPEKYMEIMPPLLPAHRALVFLSGVLEIAGGAGLLPARTRRYAALGLALLLLAVWPANFQMFFNAHERSAPTLTQILLLLRLPLQLPLIWWMLRIHRHG